MRDRSTKKKWMRMMALIVVLTMITSLFGGCSGSKSGKPAFLNSYSYGSDKYISDRISLNYSKVSAGYTAKAYAGEEKVWHFAERLPESEMLTSDIRSFKGADKVLDVSVDDVVEFFIEVPETALYVMSYEYLSYDESIMPMEFAMEIDGKYPFYECRNVELDVTWMQKGEPAVDRYGDEVVTIPDKVIKWEKTALKDGSDRHADALLLELTEGVHKVRMTVNGGNFLLGSVSLSAPEEIPAYTGSQAAAGNILIDIQGEDYAWTNDSAVHAVAEYDSSVSPYEVKNTVLNTIDADSFGTAGQSVTYSFPVEKAGYYYIGMNYSQSSKTDFPVFLDVAVDGEVIHEAFKSYEMDYTSKYQVHTLADKDGNKMSVYLEPGTHTVTYTISLEAICYILEAIEEIMAGVNDLSLEITKVAGTNADKYRDLQLSRYIPDLEDQLYSYAAWLYDLEASARIYTNGADSVAVLSSLIIAAEQLISLAEEPDEIPYRIGELATSSNSVNQHLANTIDSLLQNGISIDRVYIYQEDAQLPKGPNFFESLWMSIKRFFASFTDQSYSASNTDPEHLQVWVNRSNQYVQVMQKMIDEQFTPATGIEVDISIMPDQTKLVLANSSGNAPDVATGINYTIPYELAIRGALVDMTQFEGFRETASVYEPGFFLTGTIGDSVYAMPETMNFWVLFYRTDVLDKLGLDVPNTMEDVVDMLPELQMRGLNFYYPTAGMLAMRNFHGTTPLLVQNGGALYSGVAQDGTTLGSEASVKGFTELTDLFTVYNMPVNIDNFYQHFRNGDLPIGIADYGTYNLLRNAAPELESSWDISVIPGTKQADGTIDRSTCGCAESTVIFDKKDDSREQKAWQFVQWWSSTAVQAEFGQTM